VILRRSRSSISKNRALKSKVYILFLSFVVFTKLDAQFFSDDAALWLNVAAEKELSKKIDLNVTLQNRINSNVSQYGQGTIDIGLLYKFNKNFRIAGDYMIREKRRMNGSYSTRHQFYAALYFRKRFNKFLFVYRNRIQMRYKDVTSSEEGTTPLFHERNKFLLRYEMNKLIDIYVSEELYSPFTKMKQIGFDKSRSAVGLIYKLSQKSSLEGYFLFQKELYAKKQLHRDFIFGITYNHRF
jgi:hypothetical protein